MTAPATAPDYRGRLERLRALMRAGGVDWVAVGFDSDLEFLTGLRREAAHPTRVCRPGDWLALGLVGQDRDFTLVVPWMQRGLVAGQEAALSNVDDLVYLGECADFAAEAAALASGLGLAGKVVAVGGRLWARTLLGLGTALGGCWQPVEGGPMLRSLRMVKEPAELGLLEAAAAIADQVMDALLPAIRPGVAEFELAAEIDRLAAGLGAEGPSFVTGVVVLPAATATAAQARCGRAVVGPGSVVALDFGSSYGGYCSDFGRTVFVGEPEPELLRIHGLVMEAQAAGSAALVPGAVAREVDAAARQVLEQAGYGENFTHRLGHGIGLDVHEYPFLSAGSGVRLEENMVFTVEPSVRLGTRAKIRVEDVVRVTPGGGRPLTRYSHKLLVV